MEDTANAPSQLPSPSQAARLPQAGLEFEDRVLGMRARLEYAYIRSRQMQQEQVQQSARKSDDVLTMIRQVIGVVDSFEDVMRMARENKKLRKQTDAVDAFRITYEKLLHMLEGWGVQQVNVLGKTYKTVMFGDVAIPEPWEVVDVKSRGGEAVVAKEVVRGLWVLAGKGRITVLRKAQVIC